MDEIVKNKISFWEKELDKAKLENSSFCIKLASLKIEQLLSIYKNKPMKLDRFETSLEIINNKIYSFNKLVGFIKDDYIRYNTEVEIGKLSIKHIEYTAEYLGKKIKTINEDT